MMKCFWLLMIAMVMTVSGCGTAKWTASLADLSGEWSLVALQGKELSVVEESRPYIGLNLDEKRMHGMSGCNRMMSTVTVDAKKQTITFGPVGGTRMACPDMSLEQGVYVALDGVRKYAIGKDGSLVLSGEDGSELMVLRRR